MTTRMNLGLAAALASSACADDPVQLEPLTQNDQAAFVGYVCSAGPDNAVFFMADTETGAIRYAGRLVRLAPARPQIPFDPADDRSLIMISAPDGAISLRVETRPGRAISDDATESFTRPVRLVIEDRSGGGVRRSSVDTELICAS